MSQFSSFVHKEFTHIRRDVRMMMILLLMPILLTLLFGYVLSTEVKDVRVRVIDNMRTPESRNLTVSIDSNPRFVVTKSEKEWDLSIIMDDELGLQILADGSEPNQAQNRVAYLQNLIASHWAAGGTQPPTVNSRMLFNPQMKSEYNFVPGIIGMIIMLVCTMMTSISIVREKETGTMELILASPLKPHTIIIAKLIPYFVLSAVAVTVIVIMSKFLFGLPIGEVGNGAGPLLSFTLATLVYIALALALGLLISCVANNQLTALLLSLLMIIPTVYMSELVFPLSNAPMAVQKISLIVPARWFIDAARHLLIQGVEIGKVAKDLIVLTAEAAFFILISLKLFKTRLE